MFQLMPLPLTVSCFSKIQIGFAFLVPAHTGSPGKRAVKRVVCVCVIHLCQCSVAMCYRCAVVTVAVFVNEPKATDLVQEGCSINATSQPGRAQ